MRLRPTTFALLFTLTAAGCGGGVEAGGKLVSGGSPYSLADGEAVNLSLTGPEGVTISASAEKDGTFVLRGPGGKGVPAGKYKVSVTHYRAVAGAKSPPAPVTKPYPEEWDIGSGNTSFTLDMSKIDDGKKGKDKK